jgi:hypothetical protein
MVVLPDGQCLPADAFPDVSELTPPEPWGDRIFRNRTRLEAELRTRMREQIEWPMRRRRYVPTPTEPLECILAGAMALLFDERPELSRCRSQVRALLRQTLRNQYRPFKPGPTPLPHAKRGAVREIYDTILEQQRGHLGLTTESILAVLTAQQLSPHWGWEEFESQLRKCVEDARSTRARLTGKQFAERATGAFFGRSESWVRDQVKHAV